MALFLNESEIESVVTMAAVVDAVEAIAREQAAGTAWQEPRQRLRMQRGMLHTMSAAWPARGIFVHKAYAAVAGTIRFRVFVYDYKTGELITILEGNRLGQMRTGAATAVAARRLLPTEAPVWAVFGTGLQAWGQIEAMLEVARPDEIRVYGRDTENRNAFADRVTGEFELRCIAAGDPESCVRDADVVITATTSKEPVFDGKMLKTGAFVAPVGANLRIKRELDGSALKTIDRIIVDDIDTAKNESGLLLTPMEAGFMNWNQIGTLPDLVAGNIPARQTPDETLCFHSLGSAAWDAATAAVVLDAVEGTDLGTRIPLT